METKTIQEIILTCGCHDTDKFSRDAFKILFPDKQTPKIVHSMGIMKDKTLRQVVNGLTSSKEVYAYYLLWSNGSVAVWDLLKGVQIR